jgi:hypothetical protein
MPRRTASILVQTYWPVAVSVAGAIWATAAFVLKELPLLEERVAGSSALTWSSTSPPNVCRANFAVSFQNNGTTSVSVSKVRVRTWLVDASPSKDANTTLSYFNAPQRLNEAEPITEVVYPLDTPNTRLPPPLVATYHAGMLYSHTFEWDVLSTEQRRFYVYVELFSPKSHWFFTGWSQVCGAPLAGGAEQVAESIALLAQTLDKFHERFGR